jgi:hypothetical protein
VEKVVSTRNRPSPRHSSDHVPPGEHWRLKRQ